MRRPQAGLAPDDLGGPQPTEMEVQGKCGLVFLSPRSLCSDKHRAFLPIPKDFYRPRVTHPQLMLCRGLGGADRGEEEQQQMGRKVNAETGPLRHMTSGRK